MKNKIVPSGLVLIGVFLSGLGALRFSTVARAVEDLSHMKEAPARISFVPPLDNPSPRRTQSGASRHELPGICDGLPVLPENRLGLTTTSDPSIFVYFTKGTTVEKARLTLKSLDEAESEYYDTVVTIPQDKLSESGGVIAFKIPEVEPELVLGQEYAWSLILMCEGQLRPDSPVLSGSLKRVENIELAAQEGHDSLVEKAITYGEAGLWYDLLSTLATIRSEDNSASFDEQWASVMSTVGLSVLANEPLVVEE